MDDAYAILLCEANLPTIAYSDNVTVDSIRSLYNTSTYDRPMDAVYALWDNNDGHVLLTVINEKELKKQFTYNPRDITHKVTILTRK